MAASNINKRRMAADVLRLVNSNFDVKLLGGVNELQVKFTGPPGSLYEKGVWDIHVLLANEYPFKAPRIQFMNEIFHPNIDEATGGVCLDEAWTALYDLCNIFESFLPQLLNYPNPETPLNSEAADLYLKNIAGYRLQVAEYVRRYATGKAMEHTLISQDECDSSDSVSSMSDYGDDESLIE